MKVKVCHITTVHPNRYDVRIFEKECTTLAEAGYDVTLIVNDELPDEVKNGIKIESLHLNSNGRLDRATRIANAAYQKSIVVNADIYHIHDPELLRIALRLRKKGKKVIFDSHEFTAMQIMTKGYIPKFARTPFSAIYRKYENYHLRRLSGLIAPCTYAGNDYFNEVSISKVIIGNYASKKGMIGNLDKIKERESKVCYVGGISESRGALHMIRAAYIAGVKLVLIGNVADELKGKMESMPEYENVEYLGVLSHNETLNEISKCKLGLTLLQNDGQYVNCDNLSTKTCEYMQLGLPVIMSDAPYWIKILDRYHFGKAVDPSDDETIAATIKEIINDECKLYEMASEGLRAIREELNWETDANKLVEFYRMIACS